MKTIKELLQEQLFSWYRDIFPTYYNNKNMLFSILIFFPKLFLFCIFIFLSLIIWFFTPLLSIINFFKNSFNYKDIKSPLCKLKIILDLDNTLIYSTFSKRDSLPNGICIDDKLYVYKRPYLDIFLQTLSKFCELVIYTSSTQEYADKVLNFIDSNQLIHEKLYRQNCIYVDNKYFKDVTKYEESKNKILIIDDNPKCYLGMKDNILPIKFWNGDEKDDSLLKIKNIIRNFYYSKKMSITEIIHSSWLSEV